jgi:hypothetical protein
MNTQRDEKARQNREQMPTVAGWVDDLRAVFGDVRVVYAEENGRVVGVKPEPGVVPVIYEPAEQPAPTARRRR